MEMTKPIKIPPLQSGQALQIMTSKVPTALQLIAEVRHGIPLLGQLGDELHGPVGWPHLAQVRQNFSKRTPLLPLRPSDVYMSVSGPSQNV